MKLVDKKMAAWLKGNDITRHVTAAHRRAMRSPPRGWRTCNKDDVFIVWRLFTPKDGLGELPTLYAICTNTNMAKYMIGIAIEDHLPLYEAKGLHVFVERCPVNHSFGSSLNQTLQDYAMAKRKKGQ